MLTALHIENFALIDHLDLHLQAGLNVLTGETGAGKSIILDALDAVLGGKASQRLVRAGMQKALVEACFALTWLPCEPGWPINTCPAMATNWSVGENSPSAKPLCAVAPM
jgi:DNA repair ATPase RecN